MIPYIFLHGFLGSPLDWDPVLSYLPEISFITPELPGHGKTPFTKELSLPLLPKMHLIGYSMGGRLAMHYASTHPENIASLTILSAHCGMHDPEEKQQRLQKDTLLAKKMLLSFDDFLESWYDQPIFAGFRPDMTHRKQHNPKELAASFLHYSLGKQPVFDTTRGFFAVGERDIKYRALYPDAHIITNAGHMVHLEQPKQVAMWIRRKI